MNKYILISDLYEPDIFEADNDKAAENYVEENYTPEDGPMTLYKLFPLTEWG